MPVLTAVLFGSVVACEDRPCAGCLGGGAPHPISGHGPYSGTVAGTSSATGTFEVDSSGSASVGEDPRTIVISVATPFACYGLGDAGLDADADAGVDADAGADADDEDAGDDGGDGSAPDADTDADAAVSDDASFIPLPPGPESVRVTVPLPGASSSAVALDLEEIGAYAMAVDRKTCLATRIDLRGTIDRLAFAANGGYTYRIQGVSLTGASRRIRIDATIVHTGSYGITYPATPDSLNCY